MIGKIERLPLRDVWKHEALDFTRWLEENIDVLNSIIGIEIDSVEREQNAGAFSVDLVGKSKNGDTVIIENQLEKSNHDHLGKIITYMSAFEAKIAIWIISDPRPEHVKAIAWLNESTSNSFYFVKVEAIKIKDSLPAPLLTLIVGPSEEIYKVRAIKENIAERYTLRYKFWDVLLNKAKEKTKLHSGVSPCQYSWLGTGAGKSGLWLNYVVRQHDAQVEFYIDVDKEDGTLNKQIFDEIIKHKDKIESEFGGELNWERLDDKKASRISKKVDIAGYRDNEQMWDKAHEKLIESMIKLEQALRLYINKIKQNSNS